MEGGGRRIRHNNATEQALSFHWSPPLPTLPPQPGRGKGVGVGEVHQEGERSVEEDRSTEREGGRKGRRTEAWVGHYDQSAPPFQPLLLQPPKKKNMSMWWHGGKETWGR